MATTLQTTPELHSSILTYQDSASGAVSNYWNFMNLKAVFLPVQTAGTWSPINAITIENFSDVKQGDLIEAFIMQRVANEAA